MTTILVANEEGPETPSGPKDIDSQEMNRKKEVSKYLFHPNLDVKGLISSLVVSEVCVQAISSVMNESLLNFTHDRS